MKNIISLAALTIASLSVPAVAMAQDSTASATAAAAPTVADADAFVASAEKDLFDFSVEGGRVAWINATGCRRRCWSAAPG